MPELPYWKWITPNPRPVAGESPPCPGVVVVNDVARVIHTDDHNAAVEELWVIDNDERVSGVIARPGPGEVPHNGALNWGAR
jgi:hypothetical protein